MHLTPLRRSSLAGSAAVAAVALLALAPIALAGPGKPALNSGDDRAVAYDGNVDVPHDDVCTVGGLTGAPIAGSKFTFTGGKDKPDLDITAVEAGVTVTGVVVKGGDAYNVYLADKLGAALPWNDLRAPDNNGGQQPAISHWYACGVVTEQPPKQEPPKQEPPKQEPPKQEQPPSGGSAPASSEAAAPTSTSAVAVAGASDRLASTGFGSAWLLGLGGALVAAGAAVLLVLRRRRA